MAGNTISHERNAYKRRSGRIGGRGDLLDLVSKGSRRTFTIRTRMPCLRLKKVRGAVVCADY